MLRISVFSVAERSALACAALASNSAFAVAAELLNAVIESPLASILWLLEVTKPAKEVSFSVSTELIKVTISANVSVSATEEESIASILSLCTTILAFKSESMIVLAD